MDSSSSSKLEVRHARLRASRAASIELLTVYWNLGYVIRQRQQSLGWGTKVIYQLAHDLRSLRLSAGQTNHSPLFSVPADDHMPS
ncbi:MAG: DUF1016 domain-containing protein [Rhodococcus sp.]|nr:DUF1016 domain-containing protein [Rhodococcus sp. (in: high G+C Gram-positive bacteria)]